MIRHAEVERAGDLFLVSLDLVVAELDDMTALRADEVIVVGIFVCGLVTGRSVSEATWLCKPAVDEQLEGTIDRRLPDVRVQRAHAGVEFVDVGVTGEVEEDLGDRAALLGHAEPRLREVGCEPGLPCGWIGL